MNKKVVVALFFLHLLSRIFFLNNQGVFFDSNEYLDLFQYPNILDALASGHFPRHEGYILSSWPIFQLAKLLRINPENAVILGQIILSALTIYCFYKFILFISDKKI